MSAGFNYNIELDQAVDSDFEIYYTDEGTNLPIDLTGFKAKLCVRPSAGGTSYLLTMVESTSLTPTETLSVIELGGSNGMVKLKFKAEDLVYKPWDLAVYDLLLYSNDDRVIKLCSGFITLNYTAGA